MPKRHQPTTLIRGCLETVTLYFDLISYGNKDVDEMKSLLENETYKNVNGPFTDWPGDILFEIMEAISERYTLTKKHLHILIHPQLQTINLSFGTGDVVSGFPLIQERCQNLKHMNISYLRHLHPKSLMDLVPHLTNLISLDLRMSLVPDEALGMIGKYCQQLTSLNLSGTSISDRGLLKLVLAEDGTHYCQKLIRLNIGETWVSNGGAALTLLYLPELKEFEYEKILEAIELIHNWGPELEKALLTRAGCRMTEITTPPYNLQINTILSSADSITDTTLNAVVNLCPDIVAFSISNARITNEHMYKLMVLTNLTTLSLTNCDGLTIDFEMGVLPVLSATGEHLKNLILTNFTYVSIPDIGRTCPRLQNLAFSRIITFHQETPCSDWFNDLEAMELWGDIDIEIDPNIIIQLISFSLNIKNLLFSNCNALSDKLFDELLRENSMKYLSHLTLDHCFHVTTKLLNTILDAENNLSMLRVWSCPNIKKENRTQIALRIVEENMDVYLDWYQYENDY